MKIPYRAKRVAIRFAKELAFFAFSATVALLIYAVIQWVEQYPIGSLDWSGTIAVSGLFGLSFQVAVRMAWGNA